MLGGTYADVADADEGGSDHKADDATGTEVTLHKITDDGTELVERVVRCTSLCEVAMA